MHHHKVNHNGLYRSFWITSLAKYLVSGNVYGGKQFKTISVFEQSFSSFSSSWYLRFQVQTRVRYFDTPCAFCTTNIKVVRITIPTEAACILLPAILDKAVWEIPLVFTTGHPMISAICFVTGMPCNKHSSPPCRYRPPKFHLILEHPVVRVGMVSDPHLGRCSGFWFRSATTHEGCNSLYFAAPQSKRLHQTIILFEKNQMPHKVDWSFDNISKDNACCVRCGHLVFDTNIQKAFK